MVAFIVKHNKKPDSAAYPDGSAMLSGFLYKINLALSVFFEDILNTFGRTQ